MKLMCVYMAAVLSASLAVSASAQSELDWVPCGRIDVGDPASEAASNYEGAGAVTAYSLGYFGEGPREVTGRMVTSERFVIRPPWTPEGPPASQLVMCRLVDTKYSDVPVTVYVNGKELAVWKLKTPLGPRRLQDVLFTIPRAAFGHRLRPTEEVEIALTSGEPVLSLDYRFYATNDWDVFSERLCGDLLQNWPKEPRARANYRNGLLFETNHKWSKAVDYYGRSLGEAVAEGLDDIARLARRGLRRARLRQRRAEILKSETLPDFATHYKGGLYAGACGLWEDALAEFRLAVQADPSHADATYRLAEALEYCGYPVAEWAPLYGRAGELYKAPVSNVVDVLVAFHDKAIESVCVELTPENVERAKAVWQQVGQIVYGASRGELRFNTTHVACGPDSPDWVLHGRKVFLPPDETVGVTGKYDYAIGLAGFGETQACGADSGLSGACSAHVGTNADWQEWLGAWRRELDWLCEKGELGAGCPAADADYGAGKLLASSLGSGHRAALRYHVSPAEYRRLEVADEVVAGAAILDWMIGPVLAGPVAPVTDDIKELYDWFTSNDYVNIDQIRYYRHKWADVLNAEERRKEGRVPLVKSVPELPWIDWVYFMRYQWNRLPMLNDMAIEDEATVVAGGALGDEAKWRAIKSASGFVDLLAEHPDATEKAIGYARTFVYSPVDQEVRMWLGFNAAAAVWVNGRRIHGGGYIAESKWENANRPYMFAKGVRLKAGWNSLAVKVDRGDGDWGFSVHVVDFDNRAIEGLNSSPQLPMGETCMKYSPPAVGEHYRWADVGDDYLELLPRLSGEDLARISGIDGLRMATDRVFFKLPEGREAASGSRYTATIRSRDHEFNNYLDWDREAAAALRYGAGDQTRDLLVIKPEYFEEFVALLGERKPAGESLANPSERILGYVMISGANYTTTPDRGERAALVIDASLGDYPADDLDLLALP